MITLPKAFFGVLATGLLLAVACGSESAPGAMDNTTAGSVQQSECPGCVLRERIASAQPGDTIDIAAGVYTMTGGELVIDKDLTLIGAGAEVTIIQAAPSLDQAVHRVIRVVEETVVYISGVTIRYGSEASTEVRMVPFHSEAVGMISSGIEAIRAEFGGGIYNQGTLTLTDSIVTENFAGGGAGIFNGAKVTIGNSSILGNKSRGYGSGLFNGGILHASNTLIADNMAGGRAGFSNWGNAFLMGVTFDGNRSIISGGGFHNASVGTMTLDSSTVSNNESSMAGGINNWGRLSVINSTISGNTARFGGGIESRGVLTLTHSPVSGNSAVDGGGFAIRIMVSNDETLIANSIIANNTAEIEPDCLGVITSLGNNLIGNDSGCGFIPGDGDTMGTKARPVDARLGALADNGEPTATNALLPGSPAIDASAEGSCPPLDQRGFQGRVADRATSGPSSGKVPPRARYLPIC